MVSTETASDVGQVFGGCIGNNITPISVVPNLFALEINPQAAAEAYRNRIVGPVGGTADSGRSTRGECSVTSFGQTNLRIFKD
jgi:anion-transporting  ArsA/GET3 family ATPase